MNAFVGSEERVRIPLSGKHCSLQAFAKHVVGSSKTRPRVQNRYKTMPLIKKGPDGNKGYAINVQVQWDEERSMFSNRGMVLQGSPSCNNYRYCMILHLCHAACLSYLGN